MKAPHSIACLTMALALTACSSPALLLHSPGTIVLDDGAGAIIELAAGAEIALFWRNNLDDGVEDSTSTAARSALVSATIIEANAGAIRLKSENWKKAEDLPPTYLTSPGMNVSLSSGHYDRPVVTVPTQQITRVVVYEKQREPIGAPGFFQAGQWMWAGAAGGGLLLMTMMADNGGDPDVSGGEALTATLVGGAAGAAVYPAFKLLKPNYRRIGKSYAIGEPGYRLQVSAEP